MRALLLTATALAVLANTASASNYINLDGTASGTGIGTLAIIQDTTNNSNTISGNGSAPGTPLTVRGPWSSVAINQYGGNDTVSGAVTAASGSTAAAVNITEGSRTGTTSSGTKGYNTVSLTIGATHAPTDPSVTMSIANTNATPGAANANSVTDVIDVNGGTLTYNLTVTGDTNSLANRVSAGGNTTMTEGITASTSNTLTNNLTAGGAVGYTLAISGGNGNTVSNTVGASGAVTVSQTLTGGNNSITDTVGQNTQVASYTESANVMGGSNTIANTVDGGAAKTVNVSLASSGNTVTNGLSGTGIQSSTLTADTASKVNYTLTAGTTASPLTGSSSANVILADVIGAANAQGYVAVTQSAPSTSLNLTVNGNGNTLGGSMASPGINVTQSTTSASLTMTVNAASNGFTYSITQ